MTQIQFFKIVIVSELTFSVISDILNRIMKAGFVISAIQSGSGKTTISLGLMAALGKKGYAVQPFKIGPDFIDPGLHGAVTGRTSWNLDRWMCGDEYVKRLFSEMSSGRDISIVEGVMGLFDGGTSSTAEISKLIGVPLILVLDVRSMAESAAAVLRGVESFDSDLQIAGVILNRVGSERHLSMVRRAIEESCDTVIVGYLPRESSLNIPGRHLGLHTAEDSFLTGEFIERLSSFVEDHIDLDRLIREVRVRGGEPRGKRAETRSKKLRSEIKDQISKIRIAVARDEAFCFYYEDNLELIRMAGMEVVYFSPLNDAGLPEGTSGLYLGGGYPELYARRLSENHSMLEAVSGFIRNGGAAYAECGGFMYLTEGIYDFDGKFHKMAGVYPVCARMRKSRFNLGYREVILKEDTLIGRRGDKLRGHEFHYSEIGDMPATVRDVYGNGGGYMVNNCLGSYIHIHFAGNMQIAVALLESIKGRHP
jgi:cobyrinic acid a,c-diamide synthase